MTDLVALGVQQPQINGVQNFNASQANATQQKSQQMQQEAAALEQVATMGLGVMGGKLDGEIDPQAFDQMVGLLGDSPLAAKLKGNPELLKVITNGSINVLNASQNAEEFALRKQQFDLELQKFEQSMQPGPLEPPKTEKRYNPKSGLEEIMQWDATVGDWIPFGGQKAPTNGVTVGEDGTLEVAGGAGGGTAGFYKGLDSAAGKSVNDMIDAGNVAYGNNIKIGQLEELLKTAPQGAQGVLVQSAGSLGINTEGLDDIQAATAIINQLVPGQRVPGSGTMSDADLALFKSSLPQIINQPGGNAKIIATIKAVNEYTIAQADIAIQVANREITPAEGRKAAREVPNPLANIKDTGGGDFKEGEVRYDANGHKAVYTNGEWVIEGLTPDGQ